MMSASQFANLLHARRVGRGKWVANCPCHEGDGRRHRPSLSIGEGRKGTVVFKCMSAGCDPKDILAAMGLSWGDVLGERDVTPQMRGRWAQEGRLSDLEHDATICWLLAGMPRLAFPPIVVYMPYYPERSERFPKCWKRQPGRIILGPGDAESRYWTSRAERLDKWASELRDRLYPAEAALRKAREQVHATIEKYGWDAVWWRWMQTDRGKAVVEEFSVKLCWTIHFNGTYIDLSVIPKALGTGNQILQNRAGNAGPSTQVEER